MPEKADGMEGGVVAMVLESCGVDATQTGGVPLRLGFTNKQHRSIVVQCCQCTAQRW